MALNRSSLQAVALVLKNKVILESATPNFYFLDVDGIKITYNARKDLWICTCIHESWRGAKVEQECYHIFAGKLYMKKLKEMG